MPDSKYSYIPGEDMAGLIDGGNASREAMDSDPWRHLEARSIHPQTLADVLTREMGNTLTQSNGNNQSHR